MPALVVRDIYSFWYTPNPGQEYDQPVTWSADKADGHRNRNIAAEAYQTAVEHLKKELGISLDNPIPNKFNASVKDVCTIVETAKKEYEDRNMERKHTGTRQSLEKLSSRIMHYSKVMDTLAQHHPEYVALVWGAMKFVLTVCHNLRKAIFSTCKLMHCLKGRDKSSQSLRKVITGSHHRRRHAATNGP